VRPPWEDNVRGYAEDVWGLHYEILDFYTFMTPNQYERQIRTIVIDRLKNTIIKYWPLVKFHVFGSVNTDLYLPSSDIDVVIFGKFKHPRQPLFSLSGILNKTQQYHEVQVISHAKVPIIKLIDNQTNLSIDISFNMENGLQNSDLIKSYLKQYQQLKPLVIVLKMFLLQRGLNEPYSGGIGSYAILLMLVNFLQVYVKKFSPQNQSNLGFLLIEFFLHYGRKFNYYVLGISTRNGGGHFLKAARHWLDFQRPYLLSIEDPQDPENDVGRSSHRILPFVQRSFLTAYLRLVAQPSKHWSPTLLSRIINPEDSRLTDRMTELKLNEMTQQNTTTKTAIKTANGT